MDFELTPEQDTLREVARDLFAKAYPADTLRALWDGQDRDPQPWRTMAELGLLGLVVPEDLGGTGGDAVDLLVVLEEAGRACIPDPLLETAAIAAPVLAASDLARTWLPRVSAGAAIVTVVLDDQPYAVDADMAHLVLYERRSQLLAAESFACRRVDSEDRSRRLFEVDVSSGTAVADASAARTMGAFGTAALLNGVSARLLEMTVEHATLRQQFGQPIGAFQAVQHTLASVFAMLESARAAARMAAYAIAHDLHGRETAASVAKASAADTAAAMNTAALQLHGGIGFTWDHELHFWLKRGLALSHAYGGAREHRASLAAALLD